jgi:hypothetical protein
MMMMMMMMMIRDVDASGSSLFAMFSYDILLVPP